MTTEPESELELSPKARRGRGADGARRRRSRRPAAVVVASAVFAGTILSSLPVLGVAEIEAGKPPPPFSFLRSTDGGDDFDPLQLAETPAAGVSQIAVNGKIVHVLYDDTDLKDDPRSFRYRRSTDKGKTWSPSVKIDNIPGLGTDFLDSGEADMVADGNNVHIVYESDPYLATATLQPSGIELKKPLTDAEGRNYLVGKPTVQGKGVPAGTTLPAGTLDPCCDKKYAPVKINRDDVFYTRSTDDGGSILAAPPVAVNVSNSPNVHNRDPIVAAQGNLVAIAYEGEVSGNTTSDANENDDILLARSLDGGATFPDKNVDLTASLPTPNDTGMQDEPGMDIGGTTLHVAFRNRGTGNKHLGVDEEHVSDIQRIGYVRIPNATTPGPLALSTPINLPVPAGQEAYFTAEDTPGVLAQDNTVHIVACHDDTGGGEGNRLLYWKSVDGGLTWAGAVVIAQGGGPCGKATIDGVGKHLSIVYGQDVNGEDDVMLVQSKNTGGTWKAPRNLSQNFAGSGDPALAMNPSDEDDVYISWVDETNFFFTLEDSQKLPLENGVKRKFEPDDVARFTGAAYQVTIDGSDVGMKGFEIDAMATIPGTDPALPQFALSFADPETLPVLGLVDDSDVVLFTPTLLGETTAGSFSMYFDGSSFGLTTSDEDIDAFEIDLGLADAADDDLPGTKPAVYFSTTGNFDLAPVHSLTGSDKVIVKCETASVTAPVTGCSVGPPTVAFDGALFGLTESKEDIDAFSLSGLGNIDDTSAYFSTSGKYSTPTASGKEEDIFSCHFRKFDDDPLTWQPNFGDLADCGQSYSPLLTTFVGDSTHLIEENISSVDLQY